MECGDANLFGYTSGDPINQIDENGECWWCIPIIIVTALAANACNPKDKCKESV